MIPWRWISILVIVVGVAGLSFSIHRWIVSEGIEEGRSIAEERTAQREQQASAAARIDTLTSLLGVLELRLADKPLDSMLVISAANVAYDLGRYELAETMYRRFIDSIDTQNTAARIDLAYVVFRGGRQDDGVDILKDVLKRDPSDQTAMFNMAYMLDQMGRTDEALKQMMACRDADPDSQLGQQAAAIISQQKAASKQNTTEQ